MKKETKIFVVYVPKGGAIKTTTVMALSQAISILKPKASILVVDADFQKNTTVTLVGKIEDNDYSTYGVITRKVDINDSIISTDNPQIDLLPASISLAGVDIELQNEIGKDFRLKEAFTKIKKDYDYIIVDTSVLMSTMVVNALTSATDLIVPARPDAFTLDGLDMLPESLNEIKQYTNPNLQLTGILIGYMNDTILARDMVTRIEEKAQEIGTKVFKSKIRTGVVVPEAQALQQSLFEYARHSKPAENYLEFAKELIGE
ncbi:MULTISPECIES: ParA family protein [unclassified Lactococcus]|uniref:ParA family protein n=1 Tax=unclassified Lactococcus TaxID=2643510 RepID=UPI0011CAED8E|nr:MULTISPECIES: AAA family ATPase [unclassified Lactococcus]MQW24028.1 AAA family ATPase [Lactococcus sp. dk101]TXK36409.1 AAA family ATPase [Lactococcus sp. dk310]TXK46984.1 AAA family ATPase [Lactococcus sp. dk322]